MMRRPAAALLVGGLVALVPGPGGGTPVSAAVVPAIAIHQNRGLDCEAAALQIVLNARGVGVSQDWILGQLPVDLRPAEIAGGDVLRWGDPYTAFVGDVNGAETNWTGYGVYAPPIAAVAQRAGVAAVGASGWNPQDLYDQLERGNPAVAWVVNGYWASPTRYWTAWDGRSIPYAVGEHAVALLGVDRAAGSVIIADPETGQFVTLSMTRFEATFATFGNMAVVIGTGTAAIAQLPDGSGYHVFGADGSVVHHGAAADYGSMLGRHLNQPVVGAAVTPTGRGYWMVTADGGIFTFGDATGYGSTGGIHLNQPIVAMATTPDGRGYWLVAADGGIFPFGDAAGYGSTGGIHLNQPIVGMAATSEGRGYWLVASDGGIFTFGDARGFGSTGSMVLNRPLVGISRTAGGTGYWLVASDGGIFTFGDAIGYGSTGGLDLPAPIAGMAVNPDGRGYVMAGSDGRVYTFGERRLATP